MEIASCLYISQKFFLDHFHVVLFISLSRITKNMLFSKSPVSNLILLTLQKTIGKSVKEHNEPNEIKITC